MSDSELAKAIEIAHTYLDHPNSDPDSDACIMARQLLRRQELIERLEKLGTIHRTLIAETK